MKLPLVLLLVASSGHVLWGTAQTHSWRRQGPCDASFTVEVPSPLYRVSWFEGRHGPSIEPDEDFEKNVLSYVALQSHPVSRQFGLVIWHVPLQDQARYRKGDFGATNFVIGGDDADPTTVKIVNVNSLRGKEYVFAKAISTDTYTRGRVFYARSRLYILVFVASQASDLFAPEADRFLNSFRLGSKRNTSRR